MKYFFLSFLWIAYCVFHSFLISIWFTNIATRLLKSYYAFFRLFYILISLYLLILLINYTSLTDNTIIITYVFPWSILRYILMIGSLMVFFWAFFFNYDTLSFFGIRQILNMKKEQEISTVIKKNGLLGLIRHPMYFALIIYIWSQTFKFIDIIVNIILTIYIIIGTFLEEKKLILEFGDKYKEYQKEVPMLIPYLNKK